EWAKTAAVRLASLESDDERIDSLRAERAEVRVELARLAAELSAARRTAADRFGAAVTTELRALAMPHAVISVPVTQQEIAEPGQRAALDVDGRDLAFGPTGIDDVEILLRPHPGAPARPIQRGASGGELSRVMLAIEVVFAGADPVPTFVFDEVDAGVG